MKVFGVGMSKTGTATLSDCFQAFGLLPSVGYCEDLKTLVAAGRPMNPINGKFKYDPENPVQDPGIRGSIIRIATDYVSFHDSPWYLLYRDLDAAFPGSKFILTTRKDARTQAVSDWYHNRAKGLCDGPPPEEYLREQMDVYERHNKSVIDYFQGREDDLLVVCWEKGDGWSTLADFLHLPTPNLRFPHQLKGNYPTLQEP
jgi:hypothetical protein